MKHDVQARLGRRIASARRARGYTQEQVAERSGLTVKTISAIERGRVNVPLMTLVGIAKVLGVTLSEIALGIDGGLPSVAREAGAIYAGRSRGEQAAIGKLLLAIDELVREAKTG